MKYIGYLIITILVSFLMKYLIKKSYNKPLSQNNLTVLEMSKAFQIIGYLGIAFFTVLSIFLVFDSDLKSSKDILLAILFPLVTISLNVLLVLIHKNMKVYFNEEEMKVFGITGKMKELKWTDVKEIKFNKIRLEFVFITNKTKINVHAHFIGLPILIGLMTKKIEKPLYEKAIKEYLIAIKR